MDPGVPAAPVAPFEPLGPLGSWPTTLQVTFFPLVTFLGHLTFAFLAFEPVAAPSASAIALRPRATVRTAAPSVNA